MKHRKVTVVLLIMLAVVVSDQCMKYWSLQFLSNQPAINYLSGFIELSLHRNYGVMLGIGANLSPLMHLILIKMGIACLIFILLFWVLTNNGLSVFNYIAWSLLLGGGLSNWLDRIIHDGYVIDSIRLHAFGWQTGIFNLADFLNLLGVVLLVISILLQKPAVEL